jgi:putative tricarboxylic transport membrane protein
MQTERWAGKAVSFSDLLRRKDVLSGLMFMAIAAFGLWASGDYPIGRATAMGTGYVPRLLCWMLLVLGILVALQGLRRGAAVLEKSPPVWRALVFVPAALLAFGFALAPLGVIVAIALLVGVGALAGRETRPLEAAGVAVVLVVLTIAVFVWGIGLTIPVWPEWW